MGHWKKYLSTITNSCIEDRDWLSFSSFYHFWTDDNTSLDHRIATTMLDSDMIVARNRTIVIIKEGVYQEEKQMNLEVDDDFDLAGLELDGNYYLMSPPE